ncbi:hypothetical protein BDQ12DRAFT_19039 [Crucibulum laeve]|uniref:Uncharacterized protein n=1 Tax=Crucibulum laeve TaxID=68775 RepID=A0A5C3MGJ9_9AGAR|nr:hypothetical protein BDQ12DRAFT_19039 [Crucibulum laeve]
MAPLRGFASSSVNASPSVSLERGSYRIRAPPVRLYPSAQPSQARRTRSSNPSLSADILPILLVLLTLACIGCFAAAYYLFNTSHRIIG